MQNPEVKTTVNDVLTGNNLSPGLHTGLIESRERRQSVAQLMSYLQETGKVCPRPWYWERFFILFKPRYEPCWLSSWWQTPMEDKKELFRKQIIYLAYRTDRYMEACRFIYELDDANWLHERQSLAGKITV